MSEKKEYFTELYKNSISAAKATFLAISILIIYFELMLVFSGVNFLAVTDTIQFMGLYIFELLPLSFCLRLRRALKEIDRDKE